MCGGEIMGAMSRYGRTETTVREFDQAGRLLSEVVTTVEERPVIEKPPGFVPPVASVREGAAQS